MVGAIILGIISICSFIVSVMQFKERGFLFNNAYIYASKEERKKMNKTLHYRQSGVVFALIGLIFAVNAFEVLFELYKLFYLVIALAVITLAYAVVSSVMISKNSK